MATEVKVNGLKELGKLLGDLPEKLQRNVMRGALRAGAAPILREAQALVPVDQGELKKSLRVSARVKQGVPTASVKTDEFYAKFVEYGTAPHIVTVDPEKAPKRSTRRGLQQVSVRTLNRMVKRGSLKIGDALVGATVEHPGAKAKPFMRPALDTQASAALVATGEYIKKRLATKHGIDTSDIDVEAQE
ncbi:HK97-gp10 family putative phage morphogenesis protein [Xenophilus sp. Marseille-Q4582]|uniref:HK97-gp10 family putative phage morphogenesis protein n=1 Tax=Xenophilus sp. Marseille-Q4582 TaxID=2866600 RepID=UPI001CE41B57|nr:HK97-gp10 family putative phage morphogenesis protein [Xenophilus sp. Marseille-Q4582]